MVVSSSLWRWGKSLMLTVTCLISVSTRSSITWVSAVVFSTLTLLTKAKIFASITLAFFCACW